jgi:hypothetical protein
LAPKPVCIDGIGGMRVLELESDFSLVENSEITLFCVEHSDLPPGTQALLGLSQVKSLALSLDFALLHPYCELRAAKDFARTSSLWECSSVLTLSSPSRERRRPALFCVGILGLCLFLIFPYLAEDGKSGLHHWISPFSEFRTLIATLLLTILLVLFDLAGALSESCRSSLFILPPEGKGRTLRVIHPSGSGPRLDPHLAPLPSRLPFWRTEWSRDSMAPHFHFEGIASHERPYGPPLSTREGLVRWRDQGRSPAMLGKFRIHPMMSNKSFGALLPPLDTVSRIGGKIVRRRIRLVARRECGLPLRFRRPQRDHGHRALRLVQPRRVLSHA